MPPKSSSISNPSTPLLRAAEEGQIRRVELNEPQLNELAKRLARLAKSTPTQLVIEWVKHIQQQSSSIGLKPGDILDVIIATISVYFAALSAMPYVNPPARLAKKQEMSPFYYVESSFSLNFILNTYSIKRFFNSVTSALLHALQNVFCADTRPDAELRFEFKKTGMYYAKQIWSNLLIVIFKNILTLAATTQALTVAFKDKKEIVLSEDSGLFPPFLNSWLNAADFGSQSVQVDGIIFANFALMYMAVDNICSLAGSAFANSTLFSSIPVIKQFAPKQDPASKASREVERCVRAIPEFMIQSMEKFKDDVFYSMQSGGNEKIQSLIKLIKTPHLTDEGVVKILVLKAEIEADFVRDQDAKFGHRAKPKAMPINVAYEVFVFIAVMLVMSIQSYLVLPAQTNIDPTDNPLNPTIDDTLLPIAEKYPAAMMALFVLIAVMSIGLIVKEILANALSGVAYTTRDKIRNASEGVLRRITILGIAGVTIGNRETATWILNSSKKDLAHANDVPSYILGILLAAMFNYLAIYMAAPNAAKVVVEKAMQIYDHTQELGLSFREYLWTTVTHPGNLRSLIRVPRFFVLHPFAILPTLLVFAFSPFSSATAQQLNREQFGELVADWILKYPTIIAIALINSMGIPSVFSEFLCFAARVGFQLSDSAYALINRISNNYAELSPPAQRTGFAAVLHYFVDFSQTRDLYHFLSFCDNYINGLKRMDHDNLFLNQLFTVLPAQFKVLSSAEKSGALYDLRHKLLEGWVNTAPEIATPLVKRVEHPDKSSISANDEIQNNEDLLRLQYGNASPNTVIPGVDHAGSFTALLGHSYQAIVNSLSTQSQVRPSYNNTRFWPTGRSGQFGSVINDADGEDLLGPRIVPSADQSGVDYRM